MTPHRSGPSKCEASEPGGRMARQLASLRGAAGGDGGRALDSDLFFDSLEVLAKHLDVWVVKHEQFATGILDQQRSMKQLLLKSRHSVVQDHDQTTDFLNETPWVHCAKTTKLNSAPLLPEARPVPVELFSSTSSYNSDPYPSVDGPNAPCGPGGCLADHHPQAPPACENEHPQPQAQMPPIGEESPQRQQHTPREGSHQEDDYHQCRDNVNDEKGGSSRHLNSEIDEGDKTSPAELRRQRSSTSLGAEDICNDVRSHWTATSASMARAKRLDIGKDSFLMSIVKSKRYEVLVLLLIIGNTIFIGVQVEDAASSLHQPPYTYTEPQYIIVLEMMFFIIFLLEWMFRVAAYGRRFCSTDGGWNLFDTFIVSIMVLEQLDRLLTTTGMPFGQVASLRMLRSVRVVRVIRMVRAMKFLSGLRVLLQTVIAAMRSMVWTCVVVVTVLYMFGVMFTQGVVDYCSGNATCRSKEDGAILKRFGSIFSTLLSLFMTMCNGISWDEFFTILKDLPGFFSFMFIVYVAVAFFAVLNVVTGIFVETTLQVATVDRDSVVQEELRVKELYLKAAHEIFLDLDKDGSNELTIEEFKHAVKDKNIIAYFNALELDFTDVMTLFVLLDRDQSGAIPLEEFLRGCMRLKGEAKSLDLAKLQYESEWLMHNMKTLLNQVTGISAWITTQAAKADARRIGE
mmetsp:Transcript_78571/g.254026  ORF Transcript_78571/g.254026 Transcript_78571/m.254026 type:complete len:684 (+) Transcript_78571:127-2178(+)